VLGDVELALLDSVDTTRRLAIWSEDPARPAEDRPSVIALIRRGAVMVLMAVPVLFAVAVLVAVASR
jgi:hypothetical protein